MGVLNWMIDLDQMSKLSYHEDQLEEYQKRISKLEEDVEILKQWIVYMQKDKCNPIT